MRIPGVFLGTMTVLAATSVQADEFPPGPMHDMVAKTCTQCHAATLITAQGKTREAWADTVTTMVSNGADISDADFNKVVDYLAANFPAK